MLDNSDTITCNQDSDCDIEHSGFASLIEPKLVNDRDTAYKDDCNVLAWVKKVWMGRNWGCWCTL